jgi:uncharacterized repeat protein (TIGR03803 family)
MHLRRLRFLLICIALTWLDFSARADVSNLTLNVIYSFTNGLSPGAGLVVDAQGNFHGTTATGGYENFGGIYEVTSTGVLAYDILFDGNPNGATPLAPLLDAGGNFYGTTSGGGISNAGTIFEISGGQFQLLASFLNTNEPTPLGPLLMGTNGLLYGTTYFGGSENMGSIFQVTSSGTISNIFSFSGSDGQNPGAGLIQGSDGNLYGTTEYGGAGGLGTIFQLTYSNTLTTLASFSEETGAFPGGLVEDALGNFYGATINGGAGFAGTIFKFSPFGPFGTLQTLFTFNITNGANPNSPLTIGQDGFLYGTTEEGGAFGAGTIFRLSPMGFPESFVSFNGADGALPRSGVMQGPDGNFYGTTSQGGAFGSGEIYQLSGFAPVIIKPPASLRWITNGTAQFAVLAAGSVPLSYQWIFDETNFILDATNISLIVTREQLTNAGSYAVIVSNAYGVVTSAVANLSVPPPTVAIIPPLPTVTNASLTISGAASGPAGIASVFYQLNSNGWFAASGTTHWQAAAPSLQPGTNTFQAQSFDPIGDPSPIKSVTTFYATISSLTLQTNGLGSIVPSFRGTNLVVDRNYTVRADPGKGQLFLSWTGSAPSTENPLTFVMQSNMIVQANFVTNPFIAASGNYEGLFFNPAAIAEQSSGLLSSLRLENSGAYSGVIVIKGIHYAFTGSFDVAAEQSTPTVHRLASEGGPVALSLTLDSNTVAGTVSGTDDNGWNSPLLAERASPFVGSAEYTMLIPPGFGAPSASPPGFGYTLVTNHNGSVILTGAVADGAAFSQIVSVVGTGDVPFYASLYDNTGLLLGWLNVGDALSATNLWWIKTSSLKAALYPAGFTNNITNTLTSIWTKPPDNYLMDGLIDISSVPQPFIGSITNSMLLKEEDSPTNSLTGIFYPQTGLLHVTFGNGTGLATTLGYCAILGDSTNGAGFFVAKTNAGSITLTP